MSTNPNPVSPTTNKFKQTMEKINSYSKVKCALKMCVYVYSTILFNYKVVILNDFVLLGASVIGVLVSSLFSIAYKPFGTTTKAMILNTTFPGPVRYAIACIVGKQHLALITKELTDHEGVSERCWEYMGIYCSILLNTERTDFIMSVVGLIVSLANVDQGIQLESVVSFLFSFTDSTLFSLIICLGSGYSLYKTGKEFGWIINHGAARVRGMDVVVV